MRKMIKTKLRKPCQTKDFIMFKVNFGFTYQMNGQNKHYLLMPFEAKRIEGQINNESFTIECLFERFTGRNINNNKITNIKLINKGH